MTTETVLTEDQIQQAVQCITAEQSIVDGSVVLSNVNACFLELEQAVLQSTEVQALRKGADRYQALRNAAVNDDRQFLDAVEDYALANFSDPYKPTEAEFDASIDAAMKKKP